MFTATAQTANDIQMFTKTFTESTEYTLIQFNETVDKIICKLFNETIHNIQKMFIETVECMLLL